MARRRRPKTAHGQGGNAIQQGLNPNHQAAVPAPRRPKGLVDLPTEILEMICLALAYDNQGLNRHPRALLNLGRSFKRMHRIAQLVLCRSIVAGRLATKRPTRRVKLGHLIRTIWKAPDLGAAIRSIELDLFGEAAERGNDDRKRYYVYGSAYWTKRYLALALREFFDLNMSKMRVPSSIPVWCRASPLPVFLLLALAPNLTKLQLTISRHWDPDVLLKEPPSPGRPVVPHVMMPKLESLRLQLHEESYPVPSTDAMHVMMHALLTATPNLASLELRGFPKLLDHPQLPNLRSLVLVNTHLSQQALANLTGAAPSLGRLCTFFYGDYPLPPAAVTEPDYDGGEEHLIVDRLTLLARSPPAATLQTMVFSDYVLTDAVPTPAMSRFANLTVLGIRYLGYDQSQYASPAPLIALLRGCTSLRGLLITGAFRMGPDGLKKLAEAVAAGQFPTLLRVKLVARESYWKNLAKIVKKPVRELFEAAGVELDAGLHELEGTAGLVREMEEAVTG